MNVLDQIHEKIEHLKSEGHSSYLDLIHNHLSRAQFYLQEAEKDEHFNNDVVYRTNQAYEGALKEAYKVLVGKTTKEVERATPFKIETYLKKNNIFKNRVLQLFENYRSEWRNESTHDYKFVVDGTEAFLALMNVSSFVYLLLNEIQERTAYNKELEKLENNKNNDKIEEIFEKEDEPFAEKLLKILNKFYLETEDENSELKEFEIIGKMSAFLEKSSDKIKVYREPNYKIGGIQIRPDFVLDYEQQKVIIEVKRNLIDGRIKIDIDQLASYLTVTGLKNGILYYSDHKHKKQPLEVHQHNVFVNETKLNIWVII
ncbi:hypothetical protein [Winogradskyella bathintestinalis]|uniref:DUF4145 domain-containing protein n=1 Tax=Winogradskyella bathintestinalis TaxID=3035208 RepID=A0ABT7ZYY6_9FLAO|nr:hypothetical protein [Winogradskyella bathintestinalis]MDN3494206.1 hypothetical protein [Winogradskyella bathintestinalis]